MKHLSAILIIGGLFVTAVSLYALYVLARPQPERQSWQVNGYRGQWVTIPQERVK